MIFIPLIAADGSPIDIALAHIVMVRPDTSKDDRTNSEVHTVMGTYWVRDSLAKIRVAIRNAS